MRTIYIDILLCVNLIINFLILCAASFYLHESVSVRRLLLGAGVGAAGALTILLPPMPFPLSMTVKLSVGVATVFAAFGRRGAKRLIKLFAAFLTATFFFGGVTAAMWYLFTPQKMTLRNGVVYLDISPVTLILCTVVCYGAFRLFMTVSGRHSDDLSVCILTLKCSGSALRVPAKLDSGNSLCEPFSQCPVIVIGRETAREITPHALLEYETVTTLRYRTEVAGVRFVPFSSVGGRGILPCFKADEVFINDVPCRKEVYIALCGEDDIQGCFRAIVPCGLLD